MQVNSGLRMSSAVLNLWRIGDGTTIIVEQDEKIQMKSIAFVRMVIVFIVILARLSVAGLLLYTGSQWLMYTIKLQDLILNAVALEYVLNIGDTHCTCACLLTCVIEHGTGR